MVKTDVSTLNPRLAAFLLAAIASTPSFGALDEAMLGKAEGYPVCPLTQSPTEPRCLVGILSHFDEVAPARKVAKAAVSRVLKRAAQEPPISYTFREQPGGTIDSFLQRSRNTGLLTAFSIEVRVAYLLLLLVALPEPLQFIYWIPTIGTWALVLFGYCAMARMVSLLPWNRREPFSMDLLKRTFLSAPVRGNILQGVYSDRS